MRESYDVTKGFFFFQKNLGPKVEGEEDLYIRKGPFTLSREGSERLRQPLRQPASSSALPFPRKKVNKELKGRAKKER